jgi:pimeloyl-ACP methyl ester carboxylesterase
MRFDLQRLLAILGKSRLITAAGEQFIGRMAGWILANQRYPMKEKDMSQSLRQLLAVCFIFSLVSWNSIYAQCARDEMSVGGSAANLSPDGALPVISKNIAGASGNEKTTDSHTIEVNPIEVKRDDGSIIRYYLDRKSPKSYTKTLLVILQGSDCNSVSKIKAIGRLRNVCPDADMLTVEKYGITEALTYSNEVERNDCPDDYLLHDNPEQRVSDLDKVISILRKNYHYSKIIIIGGSEGTTVADIITAQADYISATVVFGGGGRFFLDDVLHSMQFLGLSKEELRRNSEGFQQLAQSVLSHEPFELSMSNHGYGWWRQMLSTDREELLAKISTPVLIVQGGDDKSASPTKATEMVSSLQAKGKTNIDYYLYPGYDHSLNLSVKNRSSEKVIEDIKNWLIKKAL